MDKSPRRSTGSCGFFRENFFAPQVFQSFFHFSTAALRDNHLGVKNDHFFEEYGDKIPHGIFMNGKSMIN